MEKRTIVSNWRLTRTVDPEARVPWFLWPWPCERASENLLVHQCRSTKDKGSRMRRTEGQGRGSGLGRARRRRKDPRAKQEMWGTTSRSENSGWLLRLLQTGWKLKNWPGSSSTWLTLLTLTETDLCLESAGGGESVESWSENRKVWSSKSLVSLSGDCRSPWLSLEPLPNTSKLGVCDDAGVSNCEENERSFLLLLDRHTLAAWSFLLFNHLKINSLYSFLFASMRNFLKLWASRSCW